MDEGYFLVLSLALASVESNHRRGGDPYFWLDGKTKREERVSDGEDPYETVEEENSVGVFRRRLWYPDLYPWGDVAPGWSFVWGTREQSLIPILFFSTHAYTMRDVDQRRDGGVPRGALVWVKTPRGIQWVLPGRVPITKIQDPVHAKISLRRNGWGMRLQGRTLRLGGCISLSGVGDATSWLIRLAFYEGQLFSGGRDRPALAPPTAPRKVECPRILGLHDPIALEILRAIATRGGFSPPNTGDKDG